MGNEMLFKLVVPAIFLILWALNQLFNKEANAPAEKSPVPGPRPGGLPPAPRPRPVPPLESTARRADNDEIVIIRAESNPTRPTARPGSAARRPPRPRPAPAAGPRRPAEPTAPSRSLGGLAPTGVSQTIDRPLELRPLAGPLTAPTPAASSAPLLIGVAPAPSSAALLLALTDRARVREALLLNEILGPPVALRGRKPTRPEGRT